MFLLVSTKKTLTKEYSSFKFLIYGMLPWLQFCSVAPLIRSRDAAFDSPCFGKLVPGLTLETQHRQAAMVQTASHVFWPP